MAMKPAFAENAQIEHPKFGCGTVLSCDERYVEIVFDDHKETKKFVASIVVPNLNSIDREPPEKKPRARRARAKKTTAKKTTAKKTTAAKKVKAAAK